ncbi:Vi polysaccharide biosynthesis UDP-N-acetylglucosamine C-6 dehydrogenase TviB [Ekhidna sp.]|jgi:UDP-N-acetyl-D-galactosamine dehydrogenase|uniref:Vi polysaccharide biosynthesis UDP-N-acetylglucosamine C-6 dehydrogenase TviB n=1 Tax=Ekhidna sp. TaxID=2608089 RepID=UPI0032EBE8F1
MKKIAVIGLGYVGLPLAVEFGKKRMVIGYDINQSRIDELKNGYDRTLEVDSAELKSSSNLYFTIDKEELRKADIFIITVPTPINKYKQPDLSPLLSASRLVGEVLKKGDIIIYESTVYPGCTEDDCVPVLEEISGLTFNKDFYCGYSPERINPGDKVHRLPNIKKVTSGSTNEIAEEVDQLYQTIISAGTFKASSIKAAEAAKVIENSQRDLNIAFVNELALIFDKLNINTSDVLEAAATKWNFLPFKPGLVGGHCIGVDPYYLTHKAEALGYHPEVILAGRRINDNMGVYISNQVIKIMVQKGIPVKNSKALVLGITFKENCPDIRNSKVIDVITELKSFGLDVDVFDPHADTQEVQEEYSLNLLETIEGKYDAIVLAVSHEDFKELSIESIANKEAVIYDIKGFLDSDLVDKTL